MSVTGTDIRLKAAPNAGRGFILAALLLATLAGGFAIGRQTVPTARTPEATAGRLISTTWLDDTPAVRSEVMQAMNEMPIAVAPWLDTTSTTASVMRHMNDLGRGAEANGRAAIALHVIRYFNELASTAR
jgi:hypothetical protein